MRRSLALIPLVTLLGVADLSAQDGSHLVAGVTVAVLRLASNDAGSRRVSSGTLVGGSLRSRVGVAVLSATYREGQVQPAGATAGTAYVEGSVTGSVQVHPWLALDAGVSAHRVDEVAPERWVIWTVGARAEIPVLGDAVRGWAAYDQGLGGSVSLPNGAIHARAGGVGMVFVPPGHPFRIDVATELERDDAGAERSRTLQRLTIGFAWRGL